MTHGEITTKEQEREALAKIKKILGGLEPDSYVNTAFKGCIEIAESNIDNDFACSLKESLESQKRAYDALEAEWQIYKEQRDVLQKENDALKSSIDSLMGWQTCEESGGVSEK